jgi:hypothetical protein
MSRFAYRPRADQAGVGPQDFDLVEPRYIVVPALMWAAVIVAALLGTGTVSSITTDVATPAPMLDSSTWGA